MSTTWWTHSMCRSSPECVSEESAAIWTQLHSRWEPWERSSPCHLIDLKINLTTTRAVGQHANGGELRVGTPFSRTSHTSTMVGPWSISWPVSSPTICISRALRSGRLWRRSRDANIHLRDFHFGLGFLADRLVESAACICDVVLAFSRSRQPRSVNRNSDSNSFW